MPIDSKNLEELLTRYWSVLVEWIGGARDGAEDVVQAAFIKLAAEEPPPTNCVAWLFTVTKHLAINERVSQAKRHSRERRVGTQRAESNHSGPNYELQDLLDTLENRERDIIVARIWGELTFDQIGLACGESKATVWRTYQSGLSKLRNAYREYRNE
jgi:RNA polymerase sigma-70 factor (ECF subfamily)